MTTTGRPAPGPVPALPRDWAILPEALEDLRQRYEAAAPWDNVPAIGEPRPYEVKDGVACIPLTGPLLRHPGILGILFGATSYVDFAKAVTAAAADPLVREISLLIDTPGGDVNGVVEAAAAVFAVRGVKPIVARVLGLCCSAGYWIASAADRIEATPTARIGCLGAMSRIEPSGVAVIRSSRTPRKNLGAETEEGRAAMQRNADDLGEVFADAIALHRGRDASTVFEDYGAGDTFVAARALSLGLIDAIAGQPGSTPSSTPLGNTRAHREESDLVDNPTPAQKPVPPVVPVASAAQVVLTAAEYEALKAQSAMAVDAQTVAAAAAAQLTKAQAEVAEAKAQAAGAAAAVAELQKAEAARADRERIAARDAVIAQAHADGKITAGDIDGWRKDADDFGNDRIAAQLARLPKGAARPVGLNGHAEPTASDDVNTPADLNRYVQRVAAEQFKGDFSAALTHVRETEPAKYARAYSGKGGGK